MSAELGRCIRVHLSQMCLRMNPAPMTSSVRVLSWHGLDLDWESVVGIVADADAFPGPLTRDDLVACACTMDCTAGLALSSLLPLLGRAESSWALCHSCALNMLSLCRHADKCYDIKCMHEWPS